MESELKIRHNLLNEENAELKSRLNVQRKQVEKLQAENKKLVEKYKEFKMVRMFFDSTVCMYV